MVQTCINVIKSSGNLKSSVTYSFFYMKPFKLLSIRRNCDISHFSKIYPLSVITNSSVDAYSYISYSCKINNTTIGKFCSIAQNVKMGLGKHPTNFISTSPIFYAPKNPLYLKICLHQRFEEYTRIIIGNDVWIGANSVILDGIKIADGAIIGANSIVTKDVEPYSIIGGVPAKEIRKRFGPEIIENLLLLKWWDYSLQKLEEKSLLQLFSQEIDIHTIEYLLKRLNCK